MMGRETRAVVFRVVPRREDDLMCDLLTRDMGRVWGLARSARKSRKRFGTTLAPLNILKLSFQEKSNFPFLLLREASLEVPLTHIQSNLNRLGVAFFFIETLREFMPEKAPEPKKFDLLVEALTALNDGKDPTHVKLVFEKRLLRLAGLQPHLKSCLRCGEEKEEYYFIFKEGGVFCVTCLPPGQAFEKIVRGDLDRIFTPFLEYCIGKQIHSKKLL